MHCQTLSPISLKFATGFQVGNLSSGFGGISQHFTE